MHADGIQVGALADSACTRQAIDGPVHQAQGAMALPGIGMGRALTLAGLLGWSSSRSVLAAPGTLAEAPGVGIGQMLSVLAGLLIVLGVFAALVWGLKRSRALNLTGSAQLEVLGGLSFGMRDRVVLVRAEGRRVLLAVGPNGISALSEWGDETAVPANASMDFDGALQAAHSASAGSASASNAASGSSAATQAAPRD